MKCLTVLFFFILIILYPVCGDQNSSLINNSSNLSEINDATIVLEKITREISGQLAEIQSENKISSEVLSETGISGECATDVLDTKISNLTYAHSSLIISPEGVIMAASPVKYTGLIGKDLSYQPETRYAIGKKKPIVSDIFLLEEGFYGISVSYPIFSKDNKYLGYTDVTFRPDEFLRQIIIPLTEESGYEAIVIQKNGTILFENNEEELGVNVLTDSMYDSLELRDLANSVVYNESGTFNYTYWNKNWNRQVPRQIIWTTIKPFEQEWRVGVIKNLNESVNANTTTSNISKVSGNLSKGL